MLHRSRASRPSSTSRKRIAFILSLTMLFVLGALCICLPVQPTAAHARTTLQKRGINLYPMSLSEEMLYFCKYESNLNYDQGLSYGDGYNALGFFQFDRHHDLGNFLKSVYTYNPSKYWALASLGTKYNWNFSSGPTHTKNGFTALGNDLNSAWHAAFRADPTEFSQLQNCWAYYSYYDGVVGIRKSMRHFGINLDNRPDCIKGLLWGMSNLFGAGGGYDYVQRGKYYGANWFILKSGVTNAMSDEEIVTRLCDTVVANVAARYSKQPQYWNGWQNRYRYEKQKCLDYLRNSTKLQLAGVNAPSVAYVGQTVQFAPRIRGNADGVRYSYAWSYENEPKSWSPTTFAQKSSFTPQKAGRYTVYVSMTEKSGTTTTRQATLTVYSPWSFVAVHAPLQAKVGQTLYYSAVMHGDFSGLRYNYIWSRNGSWQRGEWGSASSAEKTIERVGSFTPQKAGTYTLYVEVIDQQGNSWIKSTNVHVS